MSKCPNCSATESLYANTKHPTSMFCMYCHNEWEAPASPLPEAPSPVAQAPAQAGEVALPHPGSPEASAMMDSLLAEYQHPANSKNAARAGWEAARRWLATQPIAAPVQQEAETVTVSVEEMVESVNGVSWWVVIRRGKHRQDDGKYGAEFKNRAEWHAAGLRWILGQGDKPNIRDFMDATPPAQPVLAPVVREPLTPQQREDILVRAGAICDGGMSPDHFGLEIIDQVERHFGIQATTGEAS